MVRRRLSIKYISQLSACYEKFKFNHHRGGFIDVTNIDVKIPSEHTICGRQFAGEYSVFFVHPIRKRRIVISIMIDFDRGDKDNEYFQRAIKEWQKVSDQVKEHCKRRRLNPNRNQMNSTNLRQEQIVWNPNLSMEPVHERASSHSRREIQIEDVTSPGMWVSGHLLMRKECFPLNF